MMQRGVEMMMGGEELKGKCETGRRRLQRKQEDKRTLKAIQPCQQGEEQANNAVSKVRAALQIVNKWLRIRHDFCSACAI